MTKVIYNWEASQQAMILRRHIRGKSITSIKQFDFDRIIYFEVSGGYRLILELLSRGNLILLKDNKIVFSTRYLEMKDRAIKPGVPYVPPPSNKLDLTAEVNIDSLVDFLKDHDMPIKALIGLGLGKKYALDILLSLGFEEKTKTNHLKEDDLYKIAKKISNLIDLVKKGDIEPVVYLNNDELVDFSILPLRQYQKLEHKKMNTFNDALDEFYSRATQSIDVLESLENELNRIKKRIEQQKQLIENYHKKSERYRRIANLLLEKKSEIESLLSTIRYARKELNLSWEEIASRIEEGKRKGVKEALLVKKISKDGKIILEVKGNLLEVDINTQVGKLVDELFEKAKKNEQKVEKAKIELEKSIEELNRLLEGKKIEEKKAKIVIKQPPTAWYHKFRWFFTSNGKLVLAGKDAETNEMLVKNYMEENDIFLHADIHGAAATIIKNARDKIDDNELAEAAIFAASYSSAWKEGLAAVDVFWSFPEEVSTSPPSGLYLPKGAFIIKKKRFIKNVPLELAVGISIEKLAENQYTFQLLVGPKKAIEKKTTLYVVIVPGRMSKSEAAKKIKKELINLISGNEIELRRVIESIDINKIIELLPGPSDLKGDDNIDR